MSTQTRLIRELIEAGERVVRAGLVQASGGNLSARLPGTDRFVVTKRGTWLDALAEADFVAGSVAEGMGADERQASIEWKLHQATYAARPDIGAIVHLHPQHVLLVTALEEPVRFVTLDHQFYVGRAARVPFYPAGSTQLARAAAEAARGCDAVILDHHGCSTLGDTVAMALRRALNLEEAAQMSYRLLLAGNRDAGFPAQWRDRIIES
ncbi:MAG: class II aldolase/adducin family protein [Tetrasphaera sp.]